MAGGAYSFECSATLSGTSDTPTYKWLVGPPDNRTQVNNGSSITITSDSTVSQLQFTTLMTSHGGLYTCQVTVGGVMAEITNTVEVGGKYLIVCGFISTPSFPFHSLLQSLHHQL